MYEQWEIDFQWLRVRHLIKDLMGKKQLPDVNAILFLIGIQELGQVKEEFTKEEKQDLMHIAVCRLLEEDGYYEFIGFDEEGWPHFEECRPFTERGVKQQEAFLKEKIISYFHHLEQERGSLEQNIAHEN
ncbi:MAG: hypothetical protein GVX96_06080 [Bacteroidetes bacterium]|jgi:hypothetical protein|nr:hypothetical protein [Bacteroidota bacterium]